ncbi:MAG: sensor histidine kinase [Clostridia bacterium]
MLTWFRRRRVYAQLASLSALTLALLFSFCLFAYLSAAKNAERTSAEYAQRLVGQLQQTIDNNYSSYSKIIRLISYSKDVQAFLLSDSDAERVELYNELKRTLSDTATLNAQIADILVEDRRGLRNNLTDSMIILPRMDLSDNALHISNLVYRRVANINAEYVVLGKNIHSIDSYNQTNQLIGSVFLVLTPSAFTGEETVQEDVRGLQLFLVDGNGSLLWSPSAAEQQDDYDALMKRAESLSYYKRTPLAKLGYEIVAVQAQANSLFSVGDWQTGYLFGLAMLVLGLVTIWILWARNLVSPLRHLQRFIEKVQHDSLSGLDKRVALSGYQEAQVIGDEFNALLEQIRTLTAELVRTNSDLYESQLLTKQAELSHLRSQINPHFLYNTLETMVGIAYTNNQPEIAEIARSLSIIFKFSIKGDNIVPLQTEFKIARNYVSIQHYRFSERFNVRYQVDESCLTLLVPKMILQPMIENAIVHGIEQQDGFCHLNVGARREGERLLLTVQDDGVGIPNQQLAELRERLSAPKRALDEQRSASHIGILNVDSRIKLLYGQTYGISLTSIQGKGTEVTITLPVIEKEHAHA